MAPLQLEDFSAPEPAAPPPASGAAPGVEDDLHQAAFEQGYAAGWDDATAALNDADRQLRSELARSLQAQAFTYHEVRSEMLRALAPLFRGLTEVLLPQIARAALPGLLADQLMPLAERMTELPVLVTLHPAARPAAEALLADACRLPVTYREEPALGEGQAFLQVGATEVAIDLDRTLADLAATVRDVFDHPDGGSPHG
ncbi:MAG: flagellar biosynthesis protein [Rhodobacterales bacterium]|nr:flagellar biosynthesis protein [Rhodobacterales bacterium]